MTKRNIEIEEIALPTRHLDRRERPHMNDEIQIPIHRNDKRESFVV